MGEAIHNVIIGNGAKFWYTPHPITTITISRYAETAG